MLSHMHLACSYDSDDDHPPPTRTHTTTTNTIPTPILPPTRLQSGGFHDYNGIGFASEGFVMASLGTWEMSPEATPEHLTIDQQFAAQCLIDQSAKNISSPIYGLLSGQVGAMGHSNGGAATILSSANPIFSSIMTLSAANSPAVQVIKPWSQLPNHDL